MGIVEARIQIRFPSRCITALIPSPFIMEPMRMVAVESLLGHLIYGIILGGSFVMMKRRTLGVALKDEPRETGGTDSLRRLSKQPKGDKR